MKCPKHPKYQALRKPRGECLTCWDIYHQKHGSYVVIEDEREISNYMNEFQMDRESALYLVYATWGIDYDRVKIVGFSKAFEESRMV